MGWLIAYIVITVLFVIIGLGSLGMAFEREEIKLGARILILSPVWPVLLFFGLRYLWRMAEMDEIIEKIRK